MRPAQLPQEPGQHSHALPEQLAVPGQGVLEQTEILVDVVAGGAYLHRHGVPLQADAVHLGMLRVVAPGEAVGLLLEIELGPAGQNRQIQHPVEGQLLRLAGPLLPGVPPHLGGDVHLAPVVPLGQAQGEALGVGAIGGAAVDATVVLGHQDGLVLEGGGDVHMVGLQLVN